MRSAVENITEVKSEKKGSSLWANTYKKLKKNKLAMFGLRVLVILTILSILAPILTPYERDKIDMTQKFLSPSMKHWLGTDEFGRDTFTRLIYGGRISLSVGFMLTFVSLIIGVILGCISGYFGGKIDKFIMLIVDILMCMPFFIIAIVIVGILGPSIWNAILIFGLLGWTGICRMIRTEVLSLKERDFIEASKALGIPSIIIIIKHIIPNILGSIIVYATLDIAGGILSEAGLSYLGLGVKQPTPSWGNMLADAQNINILSKRPWLWIPPGLMVIITILSINFLGNGLRDAFNPKINK